MRLSATHPLPNLRSAVLSPVSRVFRVTTVGFLERVPRFMAVHPVFRDFEAATILVMRAFDRPVDRVDVLAREDDQQVPVVQATSQYVPTISFETSQKWGRIAPQFRPSERIFTQSNDAAKALAAKVGRANAGGGTPCRRKGGVQDRLQRCPISAKQLRDLGRLYDVATDLWVLMVLCSSLIGGHANTPVSCGAPRVFICPDARRRSWLCRLAKGKWDRSYEWAENTDHGIPRADRGLWGE